MSIGLHMLDLEHFKVSGGLVLLLHPLYPGLGLTSRWSRKIKEIMQGRE